MYYARGDLQTIIAAMATNWGRVCHAGGRAATQAACPAGLAVCGRSFAARNIPGEAAASQGRYAIGTPGTLEVFGKAFLGEFLRELSAPGFEDALGIARGG